MSIKTEGVHAGEFLLSEANGARSRENIVIVKGAGQLAAGTLLAMITAANAMVPTAAGGNTGNGTIGSIAISSVAVSGTYLLTITEAAADGGTFEVTASNGTVVGTGEVGEAFEAAGLGFTLADGSTDFVEGDAFTLEVTANLGEYVAYDDDGTDDGRRTASAILYGPVDTTDVDAMAVGIVRDAEVTERLLTGLDANGRTDLAALGIVIRP
ncbi:head decoration protein [Pseudomonas sp.]|uniref:head decoration protein n=1 Tax=Pseudomonas sp. TaxID=306 RepID=UPI003241EBA8